MKEGQKTITLSLDNKSQKVIIHKCHRCGEIIESYTEVDQCPSCHKRFFLRKTVKEIGFRPTSEELCEDDMIKGIQVLW